MTATLSPRITVGAGRIRQAELTARVP